MITNKDIRQQFIDFFTAKGHKFVSSSPVVPTDDPTLLFTNAGMNQFKDIFLGQTKPQYQRAVNSQKCIRAGGKHNDLDEVGKDGYHHTFFEMLGNWSFGDYYKKEAIQWAWELLTKVWCLPKDKLYATVHLSDDEALELWKNYTDIDHRHISMHGDKDNFWEMGETGPCGPCSEIHIDRGIEFCNKQDDPAHSCAVNGDCHRYIELWNLVFMQYQRHPDKSLTLLKKKYVDTGAGFERLCQVLQGKTSNYDTDLFTPIIYAIYNEQLTMDIDTTKHKETSNNPDNLNICSSSPNKANHTTESTVNCQLSIAHNVIADHIRALTFAIADGGIPSNEGRGYVLRRILRRAARYGRKLDFTQPFLYKLVDAVVDLMGDHFTELKTKKDYIKTIIKAEEERFNQTLDKGLSLFEEIIKKNDNCQLSISGKDAFTLYDTYGFPLDLTKILAEERGLSVDEAGFTEEMEKQRLRAREASNFKMKTADGIDWIYFREDTPTVFFGYEIDKCETKIVKCATITPPTDNETATSTAQSNQLSTINYQLLTITNSPFYAESGGQVSDTGRIYNDTTEIEIYNVQKDGDAIIHYGKLIKGQIDNSIFTAEIDTHRRQATAANHTATHLLHLALKKVLGEHIAQKGSLVNHQRLRFDFTHHTAMTPDEVNNVETIVNQYIRACHPVSIAQKSIEQAKADGAVALFGEKYGDVVRVVTAADSQELCGGTHCKNTGNIGTFKILSESSISAGVRRIEAITGDAVCEYYHTVENTLSEIASSLSANPQNIIEKLNKLLAENKELSQQIENYLSKKSADIVDDLIKKSTTISNVDIVSGIVEVSSTDDLKAMGDILRQKLTSGVGILVADIDSKVSILAIVTPDLKDKIPAGKIVQALAPIVDGKGGGKPDMAMAGGKAVENIDKVIEAIPRLVDSL